MSESTGPVSRLADLVRRWLFEELDDDDPTVDTPDDDERAVFIGRFQWPGTRAEQLEAAETFFEEWVASLPRHRDWLVSELRRCDGPPVPRVISGMDDVARWVHERAPRPTAPTPSRVSAVHLVPGEGFGGSPYWQAMMSGLTAVVTDVMAAWHPELTLKLKVEDGHVYDLKPTFTLAHITPSWRLAVASANRFEQHGEAQLERLLRATRRPFPDPDEELPADPEPAARA